MSRILLGALGVLVIFGVGLFWLQGRAQVEAAGVPPPAAAPAAQSEIALPLATAADLAARGPALPSATELSKEQQRFFRYDRNRDWRISRNEMLSTRAAAFRKLDVDGNNLLTFEEWAVATVKRFEAADANRDAELTLPEFSAGMPAAKPKPKPRCAC
ncbi:hypothetical protein EYB45_06925 [Erythrobacteraceae bacterium CFH 75059]|uniref:EF-hand domain-containing protein n=1 Tax=Qipengyuania thermophila TaxID=2509361 RepID=UPI0010227D79|nr:EF-hand domain-containing protein [Qipengyuania thermophila]TCD05218.1 hypothetical protein EYB45_06925 [Erythrobacteraceae bacterium CFH 75059]